MRVCEAFDRLVIQVISRRGVRQVSLSSRKATKIVHLRAQLALVTDGGQTMVPVDLHDIPLP